VVNWAAPVFLMEACLLIEDWEYNPSILVLRGNAQVAPCCGYLFRRTVGTAYLDEELQSVEVRNFASV